MPPLQPDESEVVRRQLTDAVGYCELGMLKDARAALESVPDAFRESLGTQMVWCELERMGRNWLALKERSQAVTEKYPDEFGGWFWLGFATRRTDSPEAAYNVLKNVVGRFPKNLCMDYNFACYGCLAGKIEEAKQTLENIFDQDASWVKTAVSDTDLSAISEWVAQFDAKEDAV